MIFNRLLIPFFISIIRAALYVGFPLSEQYPNVARVNEPYKFQMANITYKSTGGNVIYSASNLPDWLQFDGQSRTFSGNPTDKDVSNSTTVTLNGVDSADNSTISQNYTIVVSSDPGLRLSSNDVMFTEIAQYGQTNGENGLVVKPGQNFNIKFDKSTFVLDQGSSREIVAYYGRSIDRSPLPNWISFNPDDLSFSGTVPVVTSDIAPSFNYGFTFIATDYLNYAGAEGSFFLLVGAHQLSTSLNETIKVNGTFNTDFDIKVPVFSSIYSDDTLITSDNISTVFPENLPSYATFHQNNFSLTGEFPGSSSFENFTIVVQDKYGNQVDIPYSFDTFGSAFTVNSLPDVNATQGEWFSYQLMNSLFTEGNATKVSVNFDNASWLSFNQGNNTLEGLAPSNLDHVAVSVSAVNDFESDEKSFNINGVTSKGTSTSSASSSSSSPSSSSKASSTAASHGSSKKSSKSNKKALAIGLGVGIPVFFILCGLILFLCCFRRRRSKDQREQDKIYDKHIVPVKNLDYEKGRKNGSKPELNGPGFGTTVNNDDHSEDAQQLAALNVLKLDEKNKDTSDTKSTSSSLTHVESEYSNYYDASERPVKSWRANGESDDVYGTAATAAAIGAASMGLVNTHGIEHDTNFNENAKNRQSVGSMSTVNTENLFSVRLVEDNSNRNSNQSSAYYGAGGIDHNQFISSNSLHTILKRDDSGNIQRLDSDGNIIDSDVSPREAAQAVAAGATPIKPRLSRSGSSNLDILLEENSKDRSNDESTIYHSSGDRDAHNTTINSNNTYTDAHTENSFNLLSRFNNSASSSAANSDQQLNSRLFGSDSSLVDEFKAVQNSNGEIQWSEANTESKENSSFFHNHTDNHNRSSTEAGSPLNESFSNNSSNYINQVPENIHRYSSTSLGKKAKLVDFTRKGSLRDAAKISSEHRYVDGETAYIHDDDSE